MDTLYRLSIDYGFFLSPMDPVVLISLIEYIILSCDFYMLAK
jgi:hypothetical protein